jgi:CubicO group peptidase (beta-lactamase class C family)
MLLPLIATVAVSAHRFAGATALDNAIEAAIHDGRIPGAVVCIGHRKEIVYEKAYGNRSLVPTVEPMTDDTIFDIASLTKVVSTSACLMCLYDQGAFKLDDPVTNYIPEFQAGKSAITVRDLLTHFSGLKPDVPLKPKWTGYDYGIALAASDPPEVPRETKHIYSDINFELLGDMIGRLSRVREDAYAREHIFAPLGMTDTTYNPSQDLVNRIAPTAINEETGIPFRGVVHDPTARFMGGVAGHAGVFSTAQDLARFAQMMLNRGELDGVRICKPETVDLFTTPQTPPNQPIKRGLGWDIDSLYSTPRGDYFPIGSYGHTGFTGTSLWIDPKSQTYVILLTNCVHPHEGKSVVQLRAQVASIVGQALGLKKQPAKPSPAHTSS